MKTDNRVLYFSLNPKSVDSFYSFIEKSRLDCLYSFRVVDKELVYDKDNGNTLRFKHATDLLCFLNTFSKEGNLSCLYVIIDYPSFFNKHCSIIEYEKTDVLESYSVKDAAKSVRRAILQYPEVYFLFDESWNTDPCPKYPLFLFYFDEKDYLKNVWTEHHKYVIKGENPFNAIVNGRNNLFDGSNLRYAIKRFEYKQLKVKQENFMRIQNSRNENLAICVEEEHTQTLFNSYALYANGFRVWPIMSAHELKDYNEHIEEHKDLKLIIRDYDIQFPDADDKKYIELEITGKGDDENLMNLIDYIRGAKYLDNEKKWRTLDANCEGTNGDNNHFWKNLHDKPHYFISKGVYHIRLITREQKYKQYQSGNDNGLFQNNQEWQFLRGLYKPVTGIYRSMHNFKEVEERYEKAVRWTEEMKNKDETYFIKTDREGHHHGVPLDIYDLTKGMIDRARKYQKDGKFVISAMVAQEAMEILNGFHESLMLKAYHIYAISENAICMNLLGGNEQWLKEDAIFRTNKIRNDVRRMLARKQTNKDRKDLQLNVLNQIFSDCREFCYEKEHFLSEDAFVSAMADLNDGWDIVPDLKEFKNNIVRGWRENIKYPAEIRVNRKIEKLKRQITEISDRIVTESSVDRTNSMNWWQRVKNFLHIQKLKLRYYLTVGKQWKEYALIEIAQSQGNESDAFARADLVEGETYNTYTVNNDLTIAIKIMNVDVQGCDYVVIKFAEPVAAGWKLAFRSGQDLTDVPEGATEFKYIFADDPNCCVSKEGILPQICLMTSSGGYTAPLEVKVIGIYKHETCEDIDSLLKKQEDLTWSSSDENIVKVEDGRVDPKSSGHAVIFAYNRNMLDCYPVTVCLQGEDE